jgi:succinoglycan biosynthesis protein ExoM
MTGISICICTRRREAGLRELLDSLSNMIIPQDTAIRIIVVENDTDNKSEAIVKDFTAQTGMKADYFLETRQGISYARNRSVAEAAGSDFCCFVDDDQIVSTEWLLELVRCQREFNADGVWGANPPIFANEVPVWIRNFYEPEKFSYGTIVRKAFTNCLLLRKNWLDKISGPFDTRLNYSGGEDSYLTYQLTGMGAVIRYNPQAIAYELIPMSRTKLKYMIRRTYRIANTEQLIKSITDSDFSRGMASVRLFLRFFYGLLILIPFLIFGTGGKLKGIIKMANATGGLFFVAGKNNQFYK